MSRWQAQAESWVSQLKVILFKLWHCDNWMSHELSRDPFFRSFCVVVLCSQHCPVNSNISDLAGNISEVTDVISDRTEYTKLKMKFRVFELIRAYWQTWIVALGPLLLSPILFISSDTQQVIKFWFYTLWNFTYIGKRSLPMWLPDPPNDPLLAHRSSPTPSHSDDTDGEIKYISR